MPLDTSIYSNQGGFGEGFQSGANMAQLYRKNKKDQLDLEKEEAKKKAFNAGVTVNPDGSVTSDPTKTMAELAKGGFGQEALEFKKQNEAEQLTQKRNKLEMALNEINVTGQLLGGVTDQATYESALAKGKELGLSGIDKVPPVYDPKYIKQMQLATLSAKDQLTNALARDTQAETKRHNIATESVAREEAKNKRHGQSAPSGYRWRADGSLEAIPGGPAGGKGEALELDKKKVVETLSTKNANKIAIKNQIDATISNWDDLPDDQKVAAGRQLLKTLNSTEGADAIGAEEAKRLGSKLEFAMGNFTNTNPTQFGRDLEGFKQQALNTSQGIGKALAANQREIDKILGRPVGPDEMASNQNQKGMFGIPAANAAPVKTFKTNEIEWAD